MWPPSRRPTSASVLPLLAATLGLSGPAAFAGPPLIADMKWIGPDADAVAVVTNLPAECLIMSPDADRARLIRLGRVAFRSPALLGGLAARVGMSCNSCHRNGHDNPAFHFTGVSGEPGTADVTGAVFSTNRDDGIRNPIRIPTLVNAGMAPPFGTIRPAPDLQTFVRAAVVDEFQGAPPPESVMTGLVAYLEGLQSDGCPKQPIAMLSFEADAGEVLRILAVAIETLEHDDLHGGLFALTSLRAALERVHRRFPESILERDELIGLSRSVSRPQALVEARRLSDAIALLEAERTRFEHVLRDLAMQTSASFYDPDVLRRAIDSGPE